MRELVEFLAKSLVDRPEDVQVSENVGDDAIIYEIRVAPDDVGKLIGKQGRVVRAIRTVMRASAARQGKRVEVDVR